MDALRLVAVRACRGLLPAVVGLAALLSGCFPGAGRDDDRALAPADSASIEIAATVPVDTLALAWTARAPDDAPMAFPTSLGWTGDGRIVVVETQQGSLRLFGSDGSVGERVDLPAESYPYFAGAAGDTVAVLARGLDQVLWAVPGAGVVQRVDVGAGATNAQASTPRAPVAVRRGGGQSEDAAQIDRVALDGTVEASTPLPVAWRATGFVRAWGDSLVALSGYRPVVDVVTAAGADTLALRGFTSPQMVRSAQFMRGDAKQPPLLTSSAAPLGDRLYVVALRGDHVRIEAYGRDGRLQRALVSPTPWQPLQHVPADLAVRRAPDGRVEAAVLMQRAAGILQPSDAFLALYRWEDDSSASALPSAP